MAEIKASDPGGRYSDFVSLVGSYFSPTSGELVLRALDMADEGLAGTTRYDGSPFMNHCVNTAAIVISEIGLGRNSTISTLVHELVRTGALSLDDAGAAFGKECIPILEGLCNISEVNPKMNEAQADNFRDLIISYSSDPRVILIKLADRLEVMRVLDIFPEQKQRRKSWESLYLYAPIAHKLGLYSIKSELEDISLKFIEPLRYNEIHGKLEESAEERELFIAEFIRPVTDRLDEQKIKYTVKGRTKSIFSIWTKMNRMKIPFEEVYDIFALRIIVDCPPEEEKQQCWSIYSVITDFYTPNPDRMRDWISIPKSNGYESLHTTVVTPEGKWVEVQIRTKRMDEVAERGIAAHWRYKGVNQGGMGSEQWLGKLRELMEDNPHMLATRFEGTDSLGEIFVFTPTGDLRKLPEGATLLDFAFDIHTDLGSTCTGGRVNQRNVPIREVLRNGDIVEIFTSKTQTPKPDWLGFVVTGKARGKIRSYMREHEARAANLGREELERKIKNWKLPTVIDEAVVVLCKAYRFKTGTELYKRIADEKLNLSEIKEILSRYLSGEKEHEERKLPSPAQQKPVAADADSLVIDESIRNIDYKFAKCCNPIFGDDIFGFVTINTGITIHRHTCPNAARLKQQYPYRVLPARWRNTNNHGTFQATIRITAENTTGIVNRITDVVSDLKLNIRSMSMTPTQRGEINGQLNIEVPGTNIVDMVISRIMKIRGVKNAYRINN